MFSKLPYNNYQKFFMTNSPEAKAILDEILTIAHPELTEKERSRVKVRIQYDWVCFESHKVDIGLEFENYFMGSGYTIKDFEKAVDDGKFRIWRTVLDSKYESQDSNESYRTYRDKLTTAVRHILDKLPKPSAQQMFDYYYKP